MERKCELRHPLCAKWLFGASLLVMGGAAWAQTSLIPREALFGNPDKVQARISPDGRHLSYLAPLDGVLNIWIAPVDDPLSATPLTQDAGRGIPGCGWAYTGEHVLYSQDKNGDENTHVYCVTIETGEVRDLTPWEGAQARIQGVSVKHPTEILVAVNNRVPQFHDLYRVNVLTGESELVFENDAYVGIVTDEDYRPRLGASVKVSPQGVGLEMVDLTAEEPRTVLEIGSEDLMGTSVAGFDADGETLYVMDTRGRNTAAFCAMDPETLETTVLAEDPRCDISSAMSHERTGKPFAYSTNYERTEWHALEPWAEKHLARLQALTDGEINVTGMTLDETLWTVATIEDDGPVRYYLYDARTGESEFLFVHQEALDGLPLAKMHPVVVKSRDGLNLVSYVSLPVASDPDGDGRPSKPLPLVLFIHGGPWARDEWGFHPVHQLFADRGYAVMSVNYRGSTGFGKNFVNAATREWGGKMHDDVLDACAWAIDKGIADPSLIAITGGSYGGYATLVGLTMTPHRFVCGVDLCGPSNLITFMENVPEYWMPILPMMHERVGNPATEEGRAFLASRSPLTHVRRIRKPLLIAQGANDPRVKPSESDQIVAEMQRHGIPVTYAFYSDEGHGFARPENSLSFWAVMEAFLAEHLGGRCEPIGDAFEGSTIAVPEGADLVPGLAEAL